MTQILEETDFDLFLLGDSEEEKACSWRHDPSVEAVAECVCLACGNFCGYACQEHVKYVIQVLERQRAGRLRCRHCSNVNNITFIPLGG